MKEQSNIIHELIIDLMKYVYKNPNMKYGWIDLTNGEIISFKNLDEMNKFQIMDSHSLFHKNKNFSKAYLCAPDKGLFKNYFVNISIGDINHNSELATIINKFPLFIKMLNQYPDGYLYVSLKHVAVPWWIEYSNSPKNFEITFINNNEKINILDGNFS